MHPPRQCETNASRPVPLDLPRHQILQLPQVAVAYAAGVEMADRLAPEPRWQPARYINSGQMFTSRRSASRSVNTASTISINHRKP